MCELSAELFDFVVIFNLDKKLPQPANVNAVLKFKLYKKKSGNEIKQLCVQRATKPFWQRM